MPRNVEQASYVTPPYTLGIVLQFVSFEKDSPPIFEMPLSVVVIMVPQPDKTSDEKISISSDFIIVLSWR